MIKEFTNPITGLKVYNKELSNGLNIYVVENNVYFNKLNFSVDFGGGLKSYKNINGEDIKIKSGMAHLIEHLAFYTMEEEELIPLQDYFDNYNVEANAATYCNATSYYITSNQFLLENQIAEKFISSILNPNYTDELIKNELEVISAEKTTVVDKLDNGFESVKEPANLLSETLDYEINIIGDLTKLSLAKKKEVYEVQKHQYIPKNTTIVYYLLEQEDKKWYKNTIAYLEKIYLESLPRDIILNNDISGLNLDNALKGKVEKFNDETEVDNDSKYDTAYGMLVNEPLEESEKRVVISNLINSLLFNKYVLKDYNSQVDTVKEIETISLYSIQITINSTQIIEAEGYINKESIKRYIEYVRNIEISKEQLTNAKRRLLSSYIEAFDFDEVDGITFFLTSKSTKNIFEQLEILKNIDIEEFNKEKNKILELEKYIYFK